MSLIFRLLEKSTIASGSSSYLKQDEYLTHVLASVELLSKPQSAADCLYLRIVTRVSSLSFEALLQKLVPKIARVPSIQTCRLENPD